MNKQIRVITLVFIGLFVLLVLNISYIVVFQGKSLASDPGNTRAAEAERSTKRGQITSADGVVLATSQPTGGHYKRVYPQGALAAQLIGYSSYRYHTSGLEKSYDDYLLGTNSSGFLEDLVRKFQQPDKTGGSLKLTLDTQLQTIAEQGLAGRKGAVVALDPKTGAVLAMASSPSFDLNTVDKSWATISADPNAPLVNRATEGAYAPGSSFKIVTAAAALEEGIYRPSDTFDDTGSFEVMGTTIKNLNDRVFGRVTFKEALEFSVNAVFAQIGLKLGANRLFQYASKFGFNTDISFDVPVRTSRIKRPSAMDDVDVAWTAIGQAKTVTNPFEMALATAAIANDGVSMNPYVVSEIRDAKGTVIRQASSSQREQAVSAQTATTLTDMMVGVTQEGFGDVVNIPGIKVASKTGTAETGIPGQTHGWFVAFAPADNPQIAIAVIVENGGTGSGSAGPIVRTLLDKALKSP